MDSTIKEAVEALCKIAFEKYNDKEEELLFEYGYTEIPPLRQELVNEFWKWLLSSPQEVREITGTQFYHDFVSRTTGVGLIHDATAAEQTIMDFIRLCLWETPNLLSDDFAEYAGDAHTYYFNGELHFDVNVFNMLLPLIIDKLQGTEYVRFAAPISGLTISEQESANLGAVMLAPNITMEYKSVVDSDGVAPLSFMSKNLFGQESKIEDFRHFGALDTVLRLYWGGDVGLRTVLEFPPLGRDPTPYLSHGIRHGASSATETEVNSASLQRFARFWNGMGKEGWETLDVAVKWFLKHKVSSEDRVADPVIALESMLSEKSKSEINYRLSLRTAVLIQTLFGIPANKIYEIVFPAYDSRSSEVHGTPKTQRPSKTVEFDLDRIVSYVLLVFLGSNLKKAERTALLKELDGRLLDYVSDVEPEAGKYPVIQKLRQCVIDCLPEKTMALSTASRVSSP